MNKKSLLLFIFALLGVSIYLFIKNLTYRQDIVELTEDLAVITESVSKIVDKKYEEYKEIDTWNSRDRIDSIYLQGNELLKNIESNDITKRYFDFYTTFRAQLLDMPVCRNRLCLETQIKLQQLFGIDYELTLEYQSHFQFQKITVYAFSHDYIRKGEPLKFVISYSPFLESKTPVVVTIGNDTLVKRGPYYILKDTQNIKNKEDVQLKITMQSWGKKREFEPFINWGFLDCR